MCWKLKSFFLSILDKIAPFKEIRIKQRTEPWINADILDLIRLRDYNLAQFKVTKSSHHLSCFRQLRNKTQNSVRKAKADYFHNKLKEHRNSPKDLWKVLKHLGAPAKQQQNTAPSKIGLVVDDEICFDKLKVAQRFNEYFTSIASTLVDKLPACGRTFGKPYVTNFYKNLKVSNNAFNLAPVSEGEVLSIINNLCASKATGLDEIPAKFLKDGSVQVASPLTHIINLSLHSGVIPTILSVLGLFHSTKKVTKPMKVIIVPFLF